MVVHGFRYKHSYQLLMVVVVHYLLVVILPLLQQL